MRSILASLVKIVVSFLVILITGPLAVLVYTARRISGRYEGDSFGTVLRKLYGWPTEEAKSLPETAWLNGVRGLAAVLVMYHHLNGDLLGMPVTLAPWGATLQEDFHHAEYINYHAGHRFWDIWRLPFLRLLIISGDGQVAVFFVLSGLVLSWTPMRMIYNGKQDNFGNYLGSLMFRRWLRLYPPCLLIGIFYVLAKVIRYEALHSNFGLIFEEFWKYFVGIEEWQRPFYIDAWKTLKVPNPAFWTIPWEYSGSIFLVIVLLSVGRFRDPVVRMSAVAILSFYAATITWWAYTLFGSGILLADYVFYRGGFHALSNNTTPRSRIMWTTTMLVGLYFLGFSPPQLSGGFDIPGYEWMCFGSTSGFLIRYWTGSGAILFITGACHITSVRKFYDTKLLQYLGRISFMLYLIHNLVIENVTYAIRSVLLYILVPYQFDEIFKQDVYRPTNFSLVLIWLICTLYTTALTFLVANWLEIYIDQPCTRFSKWIDKVLTGGDLAIKRHSMFSANIERRLGTDMNGSHEEGLPLHSLKDENISSTSASLSMNPP